MGSLMSIECLKVILIIYGSKIPEYYSYEREDGFKALRYVIVISIESSIFIGLSYYGTSIFHVFGYQHTL